MIPFFLWVKEPHDRRAPAASRPRLRQPEGPDPVLAVSGDSLSAYLASSLFYRDALNALYGFGGVYASGVLGWSIIQIGIFGIVGGGHRDGRRLDRRAARPRASGRSR